MKILHTYWSKPSCGNNDNLLENRFDGGWLSMKYHCLSWALSCLKCKQFYENVELYTDSTGKKLLIDMLQLPYSKVHVCLDDINYIPKQMWAMSKIYTYSLQKEPFIHIDGDVYLWDKFDRTIEEAPLIAQNPEQYNSYYKVPIQYMKRRNFILPDILKNINCENNSICAVNAGTLGGNDISFFREYTKLAFEIFHANKKKFEHKDSGKLNVVIEQLLFYQMAENSGIDINFLLGNIKGDFSNLMEFILVPKEKKYIHLVGFAKRLGVACNMVERHLQLEFPEYYKFFLEKFIVNTPMQNHRIIDDKRYDFEWYFQYTLQVMKQLFQNLEKIESVQSIENQLEKIADKLSPKKFTFIIELFEFEKNKYEFLKKDVDIVDEFLPFEYFLKAKTLLNQQSREDILSTAYKLSDSVQIVLANYDFDHILSKTDWPSDKIDKYRRGENVYVLTKLSPSIVIHQRLYKLDMLLYYLSYQAMTGYELVNMLLEDDALKEKPIHEIQDEVYKFIAGNLLYTSFIEIVKI